jgi:hypothetical protein
MSAIGTSQPIGFRVPTVCEGIERLHCAAVLVASGTTSTFTAGSRRRQNYRRRPSILAIGDNGSGRRVVRLLSAMLLFIQ